MDVGWLDERELLGTGGSEIAAGRLGAFVDEAETCERMGEEFVVVGEEASVLSQEVSAYGVQGLNDERMGVFENEEHEANAD